MSKLTRLEKNISITALVFLAISITISVLYGNGKRVLSHGPTPPKTTEGIPLLTPKSEESPIAFEMSTPLRGTKYQPVTAQCDATPYNTADGAWIDTTLLKTKELRWCALSQDMLWFKGGKYHYGDTINVSCPMEWYSGVWIVHDCMNLRYTNRIDFLTWFDWPVLGVQPGIKIQKL